MPFMRDDRKLNTMVNREREMEKKNIEYGSDKEIICNYRYYTYSYLDKCGLGAVLICNVMETCRYKFTNPVLGV